ncbi:hypothetical protein SMICM304S_11396 [Streptomyces microflavus]
MEALARGLEPQELRMAASCRASAVPVRVSSAGTFWPGWRPWWKRRTSVTTCWTSSISFSAASSRKPESPGHWR